MTFPTFRLATSFGLSVFSGDGTLADDPALEDRLMSVVTTSGRGPTDYLTPAGQATFTIDNTDRLLDPFDSTGDLAGLLVPGVSFRLWATDPTTSTEHLVWAGYVREWPQAFAAPEGSAVAVPCVDALGLLAAGSFRYSSHWSFLVANSEPLAWYRLGEDGGLTMRDSSGNQRHGRYMNGPGETIPGHIAGDPDLTVKLNPGEQWGRATSSILGWATGRTRCFEFWFRGRPRTDSLVAEFNLVGTGTGHPNTTMSVVWDDQYGLCVRVPTFGELKVEGIEFGQLGTLRHVMLGYNGNVSVYVNGVAATLTPTFRTPTPRNYNGIRIGDVVPNPTENLTSTLVLDEVVVWDRMPADLAPATRYAAGAGTAGVAAWQQLGVVALAANLGAVVDGFATSPTDWRQNKLGPPDLTLSVLEALQAVEAGEAGRLAPLYTIDEDFPLLEHTPQVHILNRDPFESSADVVAVFTDEDDPDALHYDAIELDTGATQLRNRVTVTYTSGNDTGAGWVTLADEDSVDTYGPSDPLEVNTNLTPADARHLAEYLLDRWGRAPVPRIPRLVLNPAGDARLWPIVLGLQLGDRVQVKMTPQNTGPQITLDATVDGITHEIDNGTNTWVTTLTCVGIPTRSDGSLPVWGVWDTSEWDDATEALWYL